MRTVWYHKILFRVAVLGPCLFGLAFAGHAGQVNRSAQALVAAYPAVLERVDGNEIVWKDGTRMPFDDGKGTKKFEALLNRPDLQDQFYAPYRTGRAGLRPARNIDPGRVRYAPFFLKMYGDCRKGEVQKNLVSVPWLQSRQGGVVRVTRINGVAKKLAAVSRELDKLPDAFIRYLKPTSGTYNCRTIAGTKRPSVHGSGAAIDINVKHADYWRWSKPGTDGLYGWKNRIPMEVVKIFERHGFIWGGKWYHYDTMHFEYRPELLVGK